jgi:hypothetical protein
MITWNCSLEVVHGTHKIAFLAIYYYRHSHFHFHFQSDQSSSFKSSPWWAPFIVRVRAVLLNKRVCTFDPHQLIRGRWSVGKKETSERTIGREGIAKNQNAFSQVLLVS